MATAEFVTPPSWLRMPEEDARERVLSSRNRERVYRVIAALDQWRTMSVEQLEALVDIRKFASGERSLLSAMWNAGLVELCQMGAMFLPGERTRDGCLVRPAKPGRVLRDLEAQMSYVEWVSTTAGTRFDADRQFARHNILSTELGLRMAEFGNVGTVLGEKLSTMAMLAYAGVGDPVPTTGAKGGSDLTLVRTDGLRIAVEVTASAHGRWFYDKVEKLVRILHRRSLARTGLCVLFVVAPRRELASQAPREVLRKVKQDIQRAVRAYPGTHRDPTAARVAVASWTDLFPSGDSASVDLRRLPVERPTGPGYLGDSNATNVWEWAYYLDAGSVPFAPDRPEKMTAVLGNASGVRGVPHAVRHVAERPVLSDMVVKSAGFDVVGDVEGTKSLEHGRGAAGAPTVPARLVY
ncbi:hypothetical protein [Microbacterium sp. NPDC089695]|uniref:hypothetical protein n=1 Tax=Microbacterium sp. NPDC089695 TaxID=3364198 RepID=UPI0038125E07